MLRRIDVGQHLIDFPELKRNLVAFIFNADREFFWRSLHKTSVNVALDLELFAPDAVSLVPVYLRQAGSAIREAYTGYTFSLSPAATTINLPQSCDFAN